MSKKDPLWSVVEILPTDYAGYGGEVPEDKKDGDCSCGCRWAAYLEKSGDWLVCTKPRWAQLPHRSRAWLSQFSPRLGELTWEHQAGHRCFEWGCERWPHTLRPEQHAALVAWAKKLDDKRVAHQMTLDEPDGIVAVSAELLAVMAVAQELRDRLRFADPPITWGWSTDPDPEYWFIGEDGEGFRTREAALAAARSADDFDWPDELWLVTGARLRPSSTVPSCDTIDIGQWMEDFVGDNYGNDYAEGWPEISPVAKVVFDELIEAWADRWLMPLPWRPTGKPERVDVKPYGAEGCICTETVVGKNECSVHGPPPSLYGCRPELCSLCGNVNAEGCDMCGGTGQTCATHARSWSLCKDEVDKP